MSFSGFPKLGGWIARAYGLESAWARPCTGHAKTGDLLFLLDTTKRPGRLVSFCQTQLWLTFWQRSVVHAENELLLTLVPAPDKPPVPTRNGEAPLLAAQRQR